MKPGQPNLHKLRGLALGAAKPNDVADRSAPIRRLLGFSRNKSGISPIYRSAG